MEVEMSEEKNILVGVDGSEASLEALRWAIAQARLTGSTLNVVTAWHYPAPSSFGIAAVPPDWNLGAEAAVFLQSTIEREVPADAGLTVTQQAVEGHPAQVLTSLSEEADLLVVGSRGHGAFVGMLLGSVSEHCASNASCPVVIVRHACEDDHRDYFH
jgi:nucleotide-binding universal stress UspA family protein